MIDWDEGDVIDQLHFHQTVYWSAVCWYLVVVVRLTGLSPMGQSGQPVLPSLTWTQTETFRTCSESVSRPERDIKLTAESHAGPVHTVVQETQSCCLGDAVHSHLVIIKPGARLVEPWVVFFVFRGEEQNADASVSYDREYSQLSCEGDAMK